MVPSGTLIPETHFPWSKENPELHSKQYSLKKNAIIIKINYE